MPFGTEDLKNVRIVGSTGGPTIGLDVRITDWRIHAESLPKISAARTPVQAAGKTLPIVLSLATAFSLLGMSLGVWLFVRLRRRAEQKPVAVAVPDQTAKVEMPAPPIAFLCSHCGKNLKAKRELARKKVKCSQCGKAVLVPDAQPSTPNGVKVESVEKR